MAKASDGDLYEVLGVARDADQEEIKRAYRAAVKKFHPDAEGNSFFFRLIQQAYETLSDPDRRAAYDRTALTGREEATRAPQPPPPAQSNPWMAGPSVPAIPYDEIPWWSRVNPDARIRWRARLKPATIGFAVLGGLWLVLIVFGIATDTLANAGYYGYLVFAAVVLPTLWCVLSALLGRKPPRPAVFWSLAAGVGLIALAYYAQTQHVATARPSTLILYAVGALIVPIAAGWYARSRGQQKIDWQANLWQLRGGWQGATARAADLEQAASLTADLLSRYLTQISAVRVFRDPVGFAPNVDHVLLCGRRMVLLTSVVWPAGDYTVGRGGDVLADGRPVLTGSLGVRAALRSARRHFPTAVLRSVVLIWPAQPGRPVRTAWAPGSTYAVASPDVLVKDVGGWLAQHPNTVHRGLFRALVTARR
ncbi:MAG TPA: J domain-containing protein [Pseudonocardiaceae bacterium]|nr:J domain-containing protein [Pseudonocardiaceae bacterium]